MARDGTASGWFGWKLAAWSCALMWWWTPCLRMARVAHGIGVPGGVAVAECDAVPHAVWRAIAAGSPGCREMSELRARTSGTRSAPLPAPPRWLSNECPHARHAASRAHPCAREARSPAAASALAAAYLSVQAMAWSGGARRSMAGGMRGVVSVMTAAAGHSPPQVPVIPNERTPGKHTVTAMIEPALPELS
jgi:hypothetical protein